MKIQNDLRIQGQNAPIRAVPLRESAGGAQEEPQLTQSSTPRMRELSDALMMMQQAKVIVQEALTVSSRLSNIAGETIMTGKPAYQEAYREIAQINQTLAEHGVRITPPVQQKPEYNVPDLREDLTKLQDVLSKETFDKEAYNKHLESLREKERYISERMELAAKEFEKTSKVKFESEPDFGTSKRILANPEAAMIAQGNVAIDAVYTLTK